MQGNKSLFIFSCQLRFLILKSTVNGQTQVRGCSQPRGWPNTKVYINPICHQLGQPQSIIKGKITKQNSIPELDTLAYHLQHC